MGWGKEYGDKRKFKRGLEEGGKEEERKIGMGKGERDEEERKKGRGKGERKKGVKEKKDEEQRKEKKGKRRKIRKEENVVLLYIKDP